MDIELSAWENVTVLVTYSIYMTEIENNILFSLTILTSMDFRIVELSVILCAGTISLQTNLLLC